MAMRRIRLATLGAVAALGAVVYVLAVMSNTLDLAAGPCTDACETTTVRSAALSFLTLETSRQPAASTVVHAAPAAATLVAQNPEDALRCPPVAHVTWPYSMPLGAREAAVVRMLLPQNTTAAAAEAALSATLPWKSVRLHVAHVDLARADPLWEAFSSMQDESDKLSVVPIHLPTLLRGTPLERWGRQVTRWKLVSGPDFPYQLDAAVRLGIAYQHGGHVIPADFLRHPKWLPPAHPYVVQGINAPGLWSLNLGPLCARAHDERVGALMTQIAEDLESCARAARESTSLTAAACLLRPEQLFLTEAPAACIDLDAATAASTPYGRPSITAATRT